MIISAFLYTTNEPYEFVIKREHTIYNREIKMKSLAISITPVYEKLQIIDKNSLKEVSTEYILVLTK